MVLLYTRNSESGLGHCFSIYVLRTLWGKGPSTHAIGFCVFAISYSDCRIRDQKPFLGALGPSRVEFGRNRDAIIYPKGPSNPNREV